MQEGTIGTLQLFLDIFPTRHVAAQQTVEGLVMGLMRHVTEFMSQHIIDLVS